MRLKSSGPQLFGGSDNEDEEDGSRFDIKPQFEGQAGQKVRKEVPHCCTEVVIMF